jgi:hypothetical protein
MALTNANMDGAWTLQQKNTALQGRQHDGVLFCTADVQGNAMVPAQVWRGGVLPQASNNGVDVSLWVSALATPSLTVAVYPGPAVIPRASNGVYVAWMFSGISNVTVATADPTNPRLDLVVARVEDTALADANLRAQIQVITGTPAGIPVAPTAPIGSIPLATLRVNALATTITSAQVTDVRRSAAIQGAIRRLLPGDALSDVGFRDGEFRDTGATLDRWTDTGAGTGVWTNVDTYADNPNVIVGGNRYVTGSSPLATTSSGTEILTGTNTGPVSYIAGQAYEVEWGFFHQLSIGTDVFKIRMRETNVSGAIKLEDDLQNEPVNQPLFKKYSRIYKPTSSATLTIVGTFSRSSGAGGLDSKPDANGTSYWKVTRLGPASLIPDV